MKYREEEEPETYPSMRGLAGPRRSSNESRKWDWWWIVCMGLCMLWEIVRVLVWLIDIQVFGLGVIWM